MKQAVCQVGAGIIPGQQQLKLAKEDIQEGQRIQGSGKAFFLDADPFSKSLFKIF